jgi:adenine phosphoribosyltransferase
MLDLTKYIGTIPDFPKPGILFRDITPLLASPEALKEATRQIADHYRDAKIDRIAAVEARGFFFGALLAIELNLGMIPVRKPGKLPGETISFSYELEYGTDSIEIQKGAIQPGERILVIDDLLATGGTVEACCKLIEQVGGEVVGCAFVIELPALGGAKRLASYRPVSLISFEGE